MTQVATLLSTNAPLVEVTADGPVVDVSGGLLIADGATATRGSI
jgi:hypothetical protein